VTVNVTGTAAFSIQSITASGDFAQTNNCGSSVPGNGSCTINVTFTPTTTGDRAGNLTILHMGLASVIALYGSGGDFSISVSTPTVTITAGQRAEFDLSLSPIGGFNQPVAFSCGGAPQHAQCLPPSSITLNGLDAIGFSVEVFTTARSTIAPQGRGRPRSPYTLPTRLLLTMLAALATLAGSYAIRRAGVPQLSRPQIVLAATLLVMIVWAACGGTGGGGGGGGGNPGTPAGTYTLTVTGAYVSGSTTLAHNVTLTLTVK
jgi:hypothetical protein